METTHNAPQRVLPSIHVNALWDEHLRKLLRFMVENQIYPTDPLSFNRLVPYLDKTKTPAEKRQALSKLSEILFKCGALVLRGPRINAQVEWADYTQKWLHNPAWRGLLMDPKKPCTDAFCNILGALIEFRPRINEHEIEALTEYVDGLNYEGITEDARDEAIIRSAQARIRTRKATAISSGNGQSPRATSMMQSVLSDSTRNLISPFMFEQRQRKNPFQSALNDSQSSRPFRQANTRKQTSPLTYQQHKPFQSALNDSESSRPFSQANTPNLTSPSMYKQHKNPLRNVESNLRDTQVNAQTMNHPVSFSSTSGNTAPSGSAAASPQSPLPSPNRTGHRPIPLHNYIHSHLHSDHSPIPISEAQFQRSVLKPTQPLTTERNQSSPRIDLSCDIEDPAAGWKSPEKEDVADKLKNSTQPSATKHSEKQDTGSASMSMSFTTQNSNADRGSASMSISPTSNNTNTDTEPPKKRQRLASTGNTPPPNPQPIFSTTPSSEPNDDDSDFVHVKPFSDEDDADSESNKMMPTKTEDQDPIDRAKIAKRKRGSSPDDESDFVDVKPFDDGDEGPENSLPMRTGFFDSVVW